MKPYLKYALVTSAVLIAYTLAQYVTGIDRSGAGRYINWLSYPLMILFITLAMKDEKQLSDGYLSFGKGFKTGFLMMLVVSVIMSAFTYAYFAFINPDFLDYVREKTREEMESRDLSDEQIEQAMDFTKKLMSTGFMSAMALIGNIILGAIFSLVIAAIMKKEKPVATA